MKFNSRSITGEESNVANLFLAGISPCVMIFLTMGQVLLPCDAYCMENTTCVSLILFWSNTAEIVPVTVTTSQPLHNHGTVVVTTSKPRICGCDHLTTSIPCLSPHHNHVSGQNHATLVVTSGRNDLRVSGDCWCSA